MFARSDHDAVDGDAIFERQAGDLVEHLAGAIPDFDVLGEGARGVEVGEGAVDSGDEDVFAIGRDARGFDDAGLADGGGFAGGDIDEGELRGGVILEEIFVVRRLEHVLMGDHGRCAAEAFLDVGSDGHEGFGRGGAAVGLHHLDEEAFAIGHPLHVGGAGCRAAAAASAATARAGAAAHDGVDAHAFDLARFAGGVAEPEFDAVLGGVGEGEVGGVGAPTAEAELGVGRKVHFDLGALGNLAEG